ncbi:acyltransferase family protein [Allobranchiibius sp. GilTou38]|uniref:acyltransferase family protein n=1 Tax=Allobranchiibius sp. GilTou38 TaxID=2815210 RepID=UPI001AA17129|nr:acyltransferase family protein [Allobranchiibius sp. GilTou38]MBO1766594.1 acyltransferase [Allobranchiibius sp. GilTou38]
MAALADSHVVRTVRAALSTDLDRRGRGYRRAIDGYRGLFILLVVAYHFGVTQLVGGWIGINHFFVFSGFLIATMLIKERERTGSLDAWAFYVRRARRIVPAMTVLVLAVLAHTALDGNESHRARTAGDAFATATFWLNWRLIARNDQYFDLFDAPSPLRHVWTLAVEEQFYLFVPALIGLLYLVSRRKMVRAGAVAALAVLGAVWTAYLVGTSTATFSRLYYGTDVRSQALLVGVAVAFLHTKVRGVRRREIPRGIANTFGIIGTIASVSAFFVLGDASVWVFRDGGLLVFAILAALMGVSALDTRDLLINRIVGNRVLVHFGQISYGMYLYHWPISLWLHVPHAPVAVQGAVQFLVTWCVSVASYRLLEIPEMQYGFGALIRRGRTWAGPAVAASVAVVALVAQFVLPPADASTWDGTPLDPGVTYAAPAQPVKVAIVGDSIPASIADGFVGARYPRFDLLRYAAYGGCDFTAMTVVLGSKVIAEDPHCPSWRQQWPGQVRSAGADVVLAPAGLAFTLPLQIDGRKAPPRSPQVRSAVLGSLDALLASYERTGARELDVMNVPCRVLHPETLPVSAQQNLGSAPIVLDTTWINGVISGWVAQHQARGVHLLDLSSRLCATGYHPVMNGTTLYQDGVHFTQGGAQLIWSWLAPAIVNDLR